MDRTREALLAYDKGNKARLERLENDLDEARYYAEEAAAIQAFREVFAADTAEINSRENAMHVRPESWAGWRPWLDRLLSK
jgi:hypothetical protein